jgi:hypothetical protein
MNLSLTNPSGNLVSVLATTNLALAPTNWSALGSAILQSNGIYGFTDTNARNYPRRFYLLRSP